MQRTLAFMSSGAVDASFASSGPSSPGAPAAPGVLNFGHGFLLLGNLGSPTADAVRSACWCVCAAGVAISVGFRPNAVAFTASIMQVREVSAAFVCFIHPCVTYIYYFRDAPFFSQLSSRAVFPGVVVIGTGGGG